MIVILSWYAGDRGKPKLEFFPDDPMMAQNIALYLSERVIGQSVAIYDISDLEEDPDVLKPIS